MTKPGMPHHDPAQRGKFDPKAEAQEEKLESDRSRQKGREAGQPGHNDTDARTESGKSRFHRPQSYH